MAVVNAFMRTKQLVVVETDGNGEIVTSCDYDDCLTLHRGPHVETVDKDACDAILRGLMNPFE